MEVFKFGLKYWKRNIPVAILTKIMSAVLLTADLLLPLIVSMFVNYIIQDNEPSEGGLFSFLLDGSHGEVQSMELFLNLAVWSVGLMLFKQLLVYLRNYINQFLGLRLEEDLRKATFHKLMELDSGSIARFNTGELLTLLNTDTIMFKQLFCRIIPNIFDAVFVLVLAVVMLGRLNLWLLLVPLFVAPFFGLSLLRFRKLAKVNFRNIRSQNSRMNLTVQENVEAVRLVRSFTNEALEREKFDASNEVLMQAHIDQVKLQARFDALFNGLKQFAYIGSIAVAAVLVMKGYLLVGYLVACTDYVMKIMNFTSQINNMMFQMQQQLVSGQKMLDFMKCEPEVASGEKLVEEPVPVNIRVEEGSLVLDGKQVLKNINLEIPYGKHIGIVGGTGSGKSMLLESLIRIHDLTGGRVVVNERDAREYDLDALRREFSYVFQEVFLFSNTIDSNIAYADPDIEKEQIIEAAKHARAHGFITRLADSYDTIVGERGLGISGGQKQRVSIARALLKNAPVLVLDDSTSALDVETEKALLMDIKENYPEKTLLISAHRLSSVVDCDEILYLQDGEILERGTFAELMALDGHFANVYRIQENQKKTVVDFDALANAGEE